MKLMHVLLKHTAFLCSLLAVNLCAELQPDPLFSDHAVLQQGVDLPVWGQAAAGQVVTVRIDEQSASTTTGADGRWMVKLDPVPVGGPYELTISGDTTLVAKDVLVGEVWLCSGQSNMGLPLVPPAHILPRHDYWAASAAAANYPQIREFKVRRHGADEPPASTKGRWVVCTPEDAGEFSAVGYFFARDLSAARGQVPVGLVTAAMGASGVSNWMSLEALHSEPELENHMAYFASRYAQYPEWVKKYEAELAAYQQALQAAGSEGAELPQKPREPRNPFTDPYRMGASYYGKIAPLIPYAIKGVLWYQGENERGQSRMYRHFLRTLISSWRQAWGQGDFPFIVVQLPDHKQTPPEFRVAQQEGAKEVPNARVVVTMDVGDAEDIHPPNKEPVGQRAALVARVLAYGEAILGYSPEVKRVVKQGQTIVVEFNYAHGLASKEGAPVGFEIAGADRQFLPAHAQISGQSVVVSAETITEPKYIRYAWANVPEVNLYNASNLPPLPFSLEVD